MNDPEVQISGFILPGHVSTIIGTAPYEFLAERVRRAERDHRLRAGGRAPGRLDAREAARRRPRRSRDRLRPRRHAEGNPTARRRIEEVFEPTRRGVARHRRDPRHGARASASRVRAVRRARARRRARRPSRARSRAASAATCCAASTLPFECKLFGRAARPSTRSARAWSRPRAPAPPTTATPTTAGTRRRLPEAEPMRADRILLAHGSGGTMMRSSSRSSSWPSSATRCSCAWTTPPRSTFPPAASPSRPTRTWYTPLFFPGGDIGRLAVCGTVNDVATSGATPLYLSVGFVLEEGMPVEDLQAHPRLDARRGSRGGRAHRHGRHEGGRARARRRRVHQHRRRRRRCPRARPLRLALPSPATWCCSPARSAITASPSSQRARGSRSRPTSSPTRRRSTALVAAVLDAAPDVRCFRDPTRGGLAST